MSVSNEQLQLIERLLNLPGVRIPDVELVNEREAPIQVETATDHAICQEWGQKVAEFYSSRSSIAGSICMKPVQIKVQYDQLLEMAAAFGVRRFGAALVVICGFYRLSGRATRVGFSPIIAADSRWTTKAALSSRTPKTPSFYVRS
jgi:hypothetical protein